MRNLLTAYLISIILLFVLSLTSSGGLIMDCLYNYSRALFVAAICLALNLVAMIAWALLVWSE